MENKIDFHKDGISSVSLVDFMGSDYRILESARQSTTGLAQKGDKEDRGLIRYLWRNNHSSPFESCFFTFKFQIPLMTATQLNRHRTMSFNYYSQRYSEAIDDCYIPKYFREQGEKNHQGSGPPLEEEENDRALEIYKEAINGSVDIYNNLLDLGVSREMARLVLPESNYTKGMFSANLRNLFHFLELRLHPHAQDEIRDFAQAIYDLIKNLPEFKWSIEAFEDYTLNSKVFDSSEINTLKAFAKMALEKDPSLLQDSKVKTVLDKLEVAENGKT